MSRITLKDVARESGVSPSTVSFVLNKDPNQSIPQATQDRVRAAAKALGYRPNRMAKALREGTSRLVLLNTGSHSGSQSMASLIRGIDDELQSHGYSLLVTHYFSQEHIPQVLIESVNPHKIIDLNQFDFPDPELDLGLHWGQGMAYHATTQLRHLVDRGHSVVACVMPAEEENSRYVKLRTKNFISAAEQLAIPTPEFVFVESERDKAASTLNEFTATHPAVTALACYSDEIALLTLSAMKSLGLQAPEDLAVIGFDESPYAALWNPKLTTVHINAEAVGHRVALSALGLELPELLLNPSEVVPGETT